MFSSLGSCFRLDVLLKKPKPKISETPTCGSGAEKVGSIDDLLTQILLNLPLKPLFRFKSVSKHWNSIISDPKFQLMRNQKHNNNNNNRAAAAGLIFQVDNQYFSHPRHFFASLDRSPNPRLQLHNIIPDTLTIFHSCNGLLVLRKKLRDYYVYNPTTNKKSSTPLLKDEIRARRPRDRVVGMYLAFDPTKSLHYKVVCVWQLDWRAYDHVHQYQFEVYSSSTASWERCRHVETGYRDFNNGVYWNGAIHWLSLFGKSIYFNPDRHRDDGRPRVMPTPPRHFGCCENTSRCCFGESLGHLHCAVLFCEHSLLPRGIDVYEMRRDYSEWFVRYRVDDYSQNLRNRCEVRNLFCVVRGERDEEEEEEDSFLVLGNVEGEILRYNLDHNTCQTKKVKVKKAFFDFNSRRTELFPYIESPCSV